MKCSCDWPRTCGGLGILQCEGCGGDQCVCRCGGEEECDGCPDCREDEYDDSGFEDPEVR